jgi:hypothetical protein
MNELVLHSVTRVTITPNGVNGTLWTTVRFYKRNAEFFDVTVFHSETPALNIVTNPSKQQQAA